MGNAATAGTKRKGNRDRQKTHVLERIQALDLTPIRLRLVYREGWTASKVEKAIEEYRRFLYLFADSTVPAHMLRPPSKEVDEIWHRHIIHTKKYYDDCMSLFGRFIHHFPDPIDEEKEIQEEKERKRKEKEERESDCANCCGG